MATSRPSLSKRYPDFELLTCFAAEDGIEYFIFRDLKDYTFGYVQVDLELDNPFDHGVAVYRLPNYMSAVSHLFDYRVFNNSGIVRSVDTRICYVSEAL